MFRRGKRKNKELLFFQYFLEDNLWRLYLNLNEDKYTHHSYQHFTIQESKRRDIAVACMRDLVVHRLVYEYLIFLYDRTFIYDVWSCRRGKGLTDAINRTEKFFKKYPQSFVWRADVTKFFDNVRQDILLNIISRHVKDKKAMQLIEIIIASYKMGGLCEREREEQTSEEFLSAISPVKFSPIFI